ncbi:hypothetical protein GDO78_006895 [Eleutherodactylus coqui]|uniref:Uncharacterized protein n=1 Tax=Eleutherodactylus coqui TaxID=57060 RepID=A0A8J6FEZ7_ELECQ|nr:hypothetical protein GDO78_006895 [Eleutherodactylus coqui]
MRDKVQYNFTQLLSCLTSKILQCNFVYATLGFMTSVGTRIQLLYSEHFYFQFTVYTAPNPDASPILSSPQNCMYALCLLHQGNYRDEHCA